MRRMSRTSRGVHSSSRGDLLRRRLAAERLDELALDVDDLVELLDHVDRDADRPALVGDRARDRLADPPRRVRRELVAAAVVELLDRADEAQRALLDEVQEGQAAAEVALGDRDDEAQVGLDHVRLGRPCRRARCAWPARPPAAAVSSGTRPIERRYRRSESRLGSTVRSISGFLGASAPGLRRASAAASTLCASLVAGLPSAPTTSMPCSSRCWCSSWTCSLVTSTSSRVGGDLLEGQEAPLLAVDDELAQVVQLPDRCLVGEQYVGLGAHAPIFPRRHAASRATPIPWRLVSPIAVPPRAGRSPVTGSRTQVVSDSTRSAGYLGRRCRLP